MRTVFFAFRDAPDRRAALQTPGALDRYRLFGLDEIERRGASVRHNLEDRQVPAWGRVVGRGVNRAAALVGGLGGDFAAVLPSLRSANSADVVFATVDTVGIPVLWLKRAGVLRPPVVYASIGLPERLERIGDDRRRRAFAAVLRGARSFVAYAPCEAEALRAWLGASAPPVHFVPFGVDVEAFRPVDVAPDVDVVSVGADPFRDFELLVEVARRRPELRFLVVTTSERRRSLPALPANVSAESDLPLEAVRDRLARGRVIALPVRENGYSGATTTLLQAMAMAKPVIVSRTRAISEGYDLADGVNCRFVEPGDLGALDRAVVETTTGAAASISLGIRARETVVRSFSWERYTGALWELLFPAT